MEAFRTDDKLHSLMKRYKASNRPIGVDFRKMVGWLKPDNYTHIHLYPTKLLMRILHFFLANDVHSTAKPKTKKWSHAIE